MDPPGAPIVFVQLPAGQECERRPPPAGGMLRADYGDGGRIVRLEPDGRLRVLSEGFDSAGEFDISFDARQILFAARRNPHDSWNVWEMNADGSGARPVTRDLGNCRSPAYQATLYTIISTEPWYQIMFVSDAAGRMNEYGSGPARSLYSCKLDGSAVRRLTMNLSDDLDPFLMDDGRVLFAGWQRMDLRRGPEGRIALFGLNTDGTDYALFCGEQGRRIKHMPCVTTEELAVFVEADRVGWDGAGHLGSVNLRRNFYSYRAVTNDSDRVYHSPSPLRDGDVLVSVRPTDGSGTHGIYRIDPRTGQNTLIYDDPEYHDFHAKVLAPRPEPDGRSSVVNENDPTGSLYCLNAYLSDPDTIPHFRSGMIHGLRVIEGAPWPAGDAAKPPPFSDGVDVGDAATPRGFTGVVRKRLLGQVPVEEDGSFHLEVPADVPIQLQTLDADGMALRTCGWIWVKPHEPRGCIGCHEDPELTPENRFVLALQRRAIPLTLPAARRRTVDFRRDVLPIVDRKCSSCHNGEATPLDLRCTPGRNQSLAYECLLAGVGRSDAAKDGPAGNYVYPGQARTSPLVWRLFGRNTSRPWDLSHAPGLTVSTCPPPGAEPLTDDETQTIVEWIDLGASWTGASEDDGGKPTPAATVSEGGK